MNLMRRASFAIVAAFAALLSAAVPSSAQTLVVASCAAAGTIYAAGQAGRPIIIDITGTQCVTGGGGGGSLSATATAAAPSYSEGASVALSTDLAGNTRTLDKNSAATLAAIESPIPDCAAVPCTNRIGVVGVNTWAAGVLGAMANYGTSPGAVLVPGVNAFVTNAALVDPCQASVKSYLPITLATAAVKVIATGVAAKKIYICAIDLTNNAADSIAVFEATTGTTCGTSAVAVFGAGTSVATAATGYNFAATGGISKGNGGFSIGQTTVNNNDLCIAQSAATQLTGGITYVTQ